ncbi:MAG: hypothetical protein QGH42_04005 [Kiritimatiellia bacterium]|jgi:hypothetical protein|nr:hypothetical protein [Kiritimatiellia bacterium]MDP6810882.1 hypothetical protein [Kiritimatiellia bacterium]MDP7023400.1 hypothetical protein [Kiritimatiellia bacterium]
MPLDAQPILPLFQQTGRIIQQPGRHQVGHRSRLPLFQRDTPGYGNVEESDNGYCFCSFCQAKAAAQGVDLNDRTQRYSFNKASALEFYTNLHAQAEAYAGTNLGFSCNGGSRLWSDSMYEDIFLLHDYRNGECNKSTPSHLYSLSRETRERGKAQLLQYTDHDTADIPPPIIRPSNIGEEHACPASSQGVRYEIANHPTR